MNHFAFGWEKGDGKVADMEDVEGMVRDFLAVVGEVAIIVEGDGVDEDMAVRGHLLEPEGLFGITLKVSFKGEGVFGVGAVSSTGD